MDAVISDIHGNLEALDAVLNAIRQLGATRIICLGDLVCYGPDSIECVRRSADWDVVLAGDWDGAMVGHDPTQWSPTINEHIKWVRGQFLMAADSAALLEILGSFGRSFVENGRHFTHGTPDDIDGDYVTFHRIQYNVMVTVDKIRSIPEIDDMHGERLLVGR